MDVTAKARWLNGLRGHKLVTKALWKKLPPLYSTENTPRDEKRVVFKLFAPYGGLRWYVLEGEADSGMLFAYVTNVGMGGEFGYVSLPELEELTTVVFGTELPAVERDLYYEPRTLGEVRE